MDLCCMRSGNIVSVKYPFSLSSQLSSAELISRKTEPSFQPFFLAAGAPFLRGSASVL